MRASKDSLPPSIKEEIHRKCAAFSGVWQQGKRPIIEDYLGETSGIDRKFLLRELLLEELSNRCRAGETPVLDDYRHRFPRDVCLVALALIQITQPKNGEFLNGDMVGDYIIVRPLGRGGTAIVYLARHLLSGRHAAIKVPRPDRFRSRRDLARFLREAKLVASLEHPSIIPIFDVDLLPDGRPLIVFKYIRGGRTFRDVLASGQTTRDQKIRILSQVADAMAYVHAKGVSHLDLKPENIMVDAQGRPYVLDLGHSIDGAAKKRLACEISGTLPYMSPEQLSGDLRRVDGRSDLWALGIILHEILTGHRPFAGNTPAEVFNEILNLDPPSPRMRRRNIPPELARLCLECLEKEPRRRCLSAADLKDALDRYLNRSGLSRRANSEIIDVFTLLLDRLRLNRHDLRRRRCG